MRGEAAAEVQILDHTSPGFLGGNGEFDDLLGGDAVGVRIEEESARVAMDAPDLQAGVVAHPADQAECLAVVDAEAELRPHRMRAGIDMDAHRHRQVGLPLVGNPGEGEHFVAVVDLDHRALLHGEAQRSRILPRTIEDDLMTRHAIATGFLVLEARDHLGDRAFLMEQAADRVEIIRLVRPGELHLGIHRLEGLAGLTDLFAQVAFRKHEQRTAVLADEFGNGHSVDRLHHRNAAQPLGIRRSLGHPADGWG